MVARHLGQRRHAQRIAIGVKILARAIVRKNIAQSRRSVVLIRRKRVVLRHRRRVRGRRRRCRAGRDDRQKISDRRRRGEKCRARIKDDREVVSWREIAVSIRVAENRHGVETVIHREVRAAEQTRHEVSRGGAGEQKLARRVEAQGGDVQTVDAKLKEIEPIWVEAGRVRSARDDVTILRAVGDQEQIRVNVAAKAAGDRVGARIAGDKVAPGPCDNDVVTLQAEKLIRRVRAGKRVLALGSCKRRHDFISSVIYHLEVNVIPCFRT